MSFTKSFLILFVLFILLDFVWIGFLAKDFYLNHLAKIGRIENGKFQINYLAGALVYVLLAIAVITFVLPQLSAEETWMMVFAKGALLGLCVYGVYDLTNMATLRDWSWFLSIVDMAWGTFLCGVVTLAHHWVQGR